jgi:hypothetical protein
MNAAGWEKLKEQILIVLADYQTMSPDFCDKAIQRQGTRNDIARRIIENGKLIDDTPKKLQFLLEVLRTKAKNAGKQTHDPAYQERAGAFNVAASLVEELLRMEDEDSDD